MNKPVIILALLLAAGAAAKAGELEGLKDSSGSLFGGSAGGVISLPRAADAFPEGMAFPRAAAADPGGETGAAPGDLFLTVDRFPSPNDAPVFFAVCDSEKCHELQDKGYKNIAAALIESGPSVRTYKISGLKPGEYSISGYNDINKNGVLDRGLFSIPKEPVGFSMLDTGKLGSNPAWSSVKFTIGAAPVEVTFHLINKFGL